MLLLNQSKSVVGKEKQYYAVLLVTFHCDGLSEEIALLFKIISIKVSGFLLLT